MSAVAAAGSLGELLVARSSGSGGYVSVGSRRGVRRMAFRELYERATVGAAALAEMAVHRSASRAEATVVLVLADPLDFILGFFATLLAGLVPVPGPAHVTVHPAHRRRLRSIVQASKPSLVLTDDAVIEALEGLVGDQWTPVLPVSKLLLGAAHGTRSIEPDMDASAVAYAQYTSGSTGEPRPITIRHRHVLAQLRQAADAYGEDAGCVSVNWVPLYHDMGLVTSVLRPLYSDYLSVIIDPVDFVERPSLWLEQLSTWRATHTSSPDFGYALAARKTSDAARLDLTALRVARNAGEMVHEETMLEFGRVFAPSGFHYRAFAPSYGLAEAVLTVTTCPVDALPRTCELSRSEFRRGRIEAAGDRSDAIRLVTSGRPLSETAIAILDESGHRVDGSTEIGEVWISGPQVAGQPPYLVDGVEGYRTGDLGFVHGSELVLTGRSNERLQIRGVNYWSGEVERLAASADSRLRPGRIATFLASAADARHQIVVLAEVRRDAHISAVEAADMAKRIVRTLSKEIGLAVDQVVVVPGGTLPVTTSGKLRRAACREMFEDGRLGASTGGRA